VPRRAANTGARILVVEHETVLARLLRSRLMKNAFAVEVATSSSQAHTAYLRFRPDLIVLDVDHDRETASAFIQEIRARAGLPIIVLSAGESERDKVAMLEVGADDYLTKPIGLEELLARIRVAMRHVARPERRSESVIRVGYLEVDLERPRVLREGELVHLTPTEYYLVKQLAPTETSCSPTACCSTRSGGEPNGRARTRCTCTWRGCGRSSKFIRGRRGTSSPNRVQATGWRPNSPRCIDKFVSAARQSPARG